VTIRHDRRIGAFWLYVLLVYFLTHAPGVKIEGPIPRPDLIVHMTVFGLWTALCIACAYFGPIWSHRNILIAGIISLSYSAFDESTQVIPAINRVAAWDDWFANAAGVTLVTIAALVFARLRRR
jgi:hypothetical protein